MKKYLRILALSLLTLLLLVGCGTKPTPTKDEFTINLPSNFSEQTYGNYTYCYESDESVFFVLQEDFTVLEGVGYNPGPMTEKEYCDIVITNNGLSSETFEHNGRWIFHYESDVEGVLYGYIGTAFKGKSSFWLVQYAFFAENYEEQLPKFEEYVKTVRIN